METFKKIIKSIIQACPYSIAGKKCVEVVKGHKNTDKKTAVKTQKIKEGIKTGRNILLIGVFCPFLWYAILSGASRKFIELNLIHSGIVVFIGLLIIMGNYLSLLRFRSKT